jgi:hypothetical protein
VIDEVSLESDIYRVNCSVRPLTSICEKNIAPLKLLSPSLISSRGLRNRGEGALKPVPFGGQEVTVMNLILLI